MLHMPSGVPVTDGEKLRIRELRYEDGLTLTDVAEMLGLGRFTIWRIVPGRPGAIDVEPLRDALESFGKSACEVARHLGWWFGDCSDASRLRRYLGITPSVGVRGQRYYNKRVDAELAGRIAEAVGVAPWEVGA